MKHTDYILIANQDELNLLATIEEGVETDALLVDEPYVAFMEEVLTIVPLREIDESHKFYDVKPRKFNSWYRREMKR